MDSEMKLLERVKGDGGEAKVDEATLQALKSEMMDIKNQAEEGFWNRRRWFGDIRFCKWEGQSDDGRKHRDSNQGREPHPFEGASDARVRLADMIVQEHVAVEVAAAMRAHMTVNGLEITDAGWAAKIRTLLKWILRVQMGRQYRKELEKLAQWMEGDTPAAALMGVYWVEETGLESKSMDLEQFVITTATMVGGDPAALDEDLMADVTDMVLNENREEEAIAVVQLVLSVRKGRARSILSSWRGGEMAEFPQPYQKPGRIVVKAHRFFDDAFINTNTMDIQSASRVFIREWLTGAEVKSRVLTHGYSETFVDKVLGHQDDGAQSYQGWSAFPETYNRDLADGSTEQIQLTTEQDFKGLFEIITPYWKAVNDDGVMGVFWTTIHGDVDEAAIPRQLLDYPHGDYPFVEFSREQLSNRLLETRSVPELTMTDQESEKRHHDIVSDHASLSIPPVFVPANRPQVQLLIGPLRQIRRRRQTDYEWMKLPEFPQSSVLQQKEIRRRVDEYFGRQNPDVDQRLVILKTQDRVDRFLCGLADVMVMVVQLAQGFMPSEEIQRVVGGNGVPIARSREEIQGKFDMFLEFDARYLDPQYVLELAEALQKYVLPMDRRQTVQTDKVVQFVMQALNPQMADEVVISAEAADLEEVKDEDLNFVKIKAGIEPPMVEEGQNWGLRYQRLLDIMEQNPPAVMDMTPVSQEILQRRLQHLEFMMQQEENAQTGRVGAEPVLGDVAPEEEEI